MHNYKIIIEPEEYEYSLVEWVAKYPELPYLIGVGDTPKEALNMLEEAKEMYLEVLEEREKKKER